jgi:PhnB protein
MRIIRSTVGLRKERSFFVRAKSTPKGYQSLTPFITVDDVGKALEFYKSAFGATECTTREMDGKLLLADVQVGDSHLVITHGAKGGAGRNDFEGISG